MNASQRKYRTVAAACAALCLAILAACQPKAVKPPSLEPAPISATPKAGAVRYRIDRESSVVHVLVYRGGAMSRLGHNHVITSKQVSGNAWLHADLAQSSVDLSFPVNELIVDDAAARATQGEEFAALVPDDARAATRANLLRPEVLHGERFPTIALRSVAISGTRATPSLLMRITIKEVSRDVVVLAQVSEDGDRLRIDGEFAIQQTDFGITPFSVAMGALQVVDQLRIKFQLVAIVEPST